MKTKRKAGLAVTLALMLVLSMAACGAQSSAAESAASGTAAGLTVSAAEETVPSAAEETAGSAAETADSVTPVSGEPSDAPLEQLLAEGFTQSWMASLEGHVQIEYVLPDHSAFVLAECDLTGEQCDELFAIDMMAEDYAEQCAAYLESVGNVSIAELADRIPAQEDLDVYVGKTVEDLMADGYEQTSTNTDDDGAMYLEFSNQEYTLNIYPQDEIESPEELSDSKIGSIVIGKVVFWDFVTV